MDEALLSRYLHLFHSENLSTTVLSRLLRKFGQLTTVMNESDDDLLSAGLVSKQLLTLRSISNKPRDELVDLDLKWQERSNHYIVCFESHLYPSLLRQIYGAPPLLYVVGDPEALSMKMVAIVGSRIATAYGERNAYWMARELGALVIGICSGLARGIDAKAHYGSLESGEKTVSIMATGADIVYPSKNRGLAEKIAEQGALVTEFPLGTKPLPSHFPQRNRIISGMCLGTLVVEATEKSGSLITARYALEQNREVFAIPGIVGTEQSKGCNQLIKQGAKLVEEPMDILEELGLSLSYSERNEREERDERDEREERATEKTSENISEKNKGISNGKKSDRVRRVREKVNEVNNEAKLILNSIEPQGSLLEGISSCTGIEYEKLIEQLLNFELSGKVINKHGRYFKSNC